MKPIFFNYPSDQASYTIGDEWLFGDSLLAAPVLADVTSRSIHLPAGYWYDVKRREVVHGPTDIADYPVTLADVPMFILLGTPDTGRLMSALAPGASLPTTTVGGSVPATLALSLGPRRASTRSSRASSTTTRRASPPTCCPPRAMRRCRSATPTRRTRATW